jgi:hypothetical protein
MLQFQSTKGYIGLPCGEIFTTTNKNFQPKPQKKMTGKMQTQFKEDISKYVAMVNKEEESIQATTNNNLYIKNFLWMDESSWGKSMLMFADENQKVVSVLIWEGKYADRIIEHYYFKNGEVVFVKKSNSYYNGHKLQPVYYTDNENCIDYYFNDGNLFSVEESIKGLPKTILTKIPEDKPISQELFSKQILNISTYSLKGK